ncbi:hypothetical protein [Blastococcus sp. SYSU D00695]
MGAESTVAFLARPKPVEVLHGGRWYIGALLGWRHDADGTCWLRVSARVDGLKQTAWVPLDTVRLPRPPARPGRAPAAPAVGHVPAPRADAPPAWRADDAPTQRLPRHDDRGNRLPAPALPHPRARADRRLQPLHPTGA